MNTKKLRQKILDLAIHGKLVPQDSNDEPASVLLERIRAEKERLIKEGKIKKSKASKTSDTPHYEQVPFEVPSSWEWTEVGNIGEIVTGSTPSKDIPEYYGGDIPFYKPTDLEQGKCVKRASDHLSLLGFEQARKLPVKSVLITCIGATIGKTGLITIEGSCNQQINAIIPHDFILAEFIYDVCTSDYFQDEIKFNASATTLPILNKGNFAKLLLPLPPLAEQIRIVAEIEKWFALIEQIEREKTDLLTAIKQTKSKILDLAIHGKLVPQDENDEPASELLKRINPKAEITCDNGQYGKIPDNWCITRIKNAFLINPRNKEEDANNAGFVPMANICDGYFNRFTYETKKWVEIKTGFTHFADGDIAVAKISPCLENRKSMVLNNLPNGIGAGTTELHVFRPLCVTQSYGLWFFKSDYFVNQCVSTFNGVVGQQRVGKNIVEDILFPLPPLAEQHRIAAKIEELFSSLNNIQKALEV